MARKPIPKTKPISLLPLAFKIIQKARHYQLEDYLKKNDLLYKHH